MCREQGIRNVRSWLIRVMADVEARSGRFEDVTDSLRTQAHSVPSVAEIIPIQYGGSAGPSGWFAALIARHLGRFASESVAR